MKNKIEIQHRLGEQAIEVFGKLENAGFIEGEDYHYQGIFLQGSQNYNTHHSKSDVDSKFVYVPSIQNMILGKSISREISLDNGEKVSVKSCLEYIDLFFKGNINNLEILFTEYCDFSADCSFLKSYISDLGINNVIVEVTMGTIWDAAIGMMVQKQKSLHKGTETTLPFVEKYGYDNKDLIHIIRINGLLDSLSKGDSFGDALDFSKHNNYHWVDAIREGDVVGFENVSFLATSMIKVSNDLKVRVDPKNINPEKLRDYIKGEYVDWYMGNIVK